MSISLQPLFQSCLRKDILISKLIQPLDFIFSEDFSIWQAHSFFKLIFKVTQCQKVPEYDIFQKNTVFRLGVKYKFSTKCCSSSSRTVFKNRFYFYLLKPDHFWCKQIKNETKIFRQSWRKHLETFSLFCTIFLHHKCNGTRLLSPESECTSCLRSCQTT